MDFFEAMEKPPVDPIYGLMEAFKKDTRDSKINLGIGVYKNEQMQTPRMEAVILAERILLEKEKDKVYLPIDGDQSYCAEAGKLVFGDTLWQEHAGQFSSIQTIGGTGALSLCGELLKSQNPDTLYLPDPTWPNHTKVFTFAHLTLGRYPYYDKEKKGVAFDAMMAALRKEKKRVAVLFHVVCHNPSGMDLTFEQWEEIAAYCKKQEVLPLFDLAYLGFAEGLEKDVLPVRLFAQKGVEFFLALSFSKNFSLYGERVGALYYFSRQTEIAARMQGHLKSCARADYSSPPIHGAAIVREILLDRRLRILWEKELEAMRVRICKMRGALCSALSQRIPGEDFSFLERGRGMFSFSGLTTAEVDALMTEHGIYVIRDGRINFAGLNNENIDRVAHSISEVKKS